MDTDGKRLHVKFLGCEHWFIYIRTSQLKDHYISVDQARYATPVVVNCLDTDTIKWNTKFHKTTLPHDIIFTKEDASTSDEHMEVLSTEYTIQCRACVGPLLYLLYTIVDLCFVVHNL